MVIYHNLLFTLQIYIEKMPKRRGLPEWGELVICRVKRITPYAAWCDLEEYPNLEGMIHVTEVAGKWIKDIRKFVKLDKQYVAKVIKIDYQKNFVNLSLKRVSEKEEKEKWNSFRKEARAEKILEQIAKELNKTLDEAYEEVGFMLEEKFGSLFSAFEEMVKDEKIVEKLSVDENWKKVLIETVKKSFKEKEVEIKAEVEMRSFSKDGINVIKRILSQLEEKFGLEVRYISAPKYLVCIKGKNPKKLEKRMLEGLEFAAQEAKKLNEVLNYKMVK